ncbi:MAG: VOC family protein [Solirubrobacteraceae bacterium]
MPTNRSAPIGPVIPELAYPDVGAAVDWLVEVLGFVERVRIGPGHRAQLSFGEGWVIVADVGYGRAAPTGAGASQSVMLRVQDVASLCARVRENGGTIIREPQDFPYGERQCTILDPGGHRWTLTQTLRDVAPEEWGGVSVDER